ncbi:hypothetical protein LTR66_008202 [Elasticomyces elasticus]|nr:hypothetical protein LTR66_008202 [Elasticomyces elasticus]KAK4991239.1 hypothetical protein LTR50_001997 [Elasticomyces elasticus]
MAPITETAPSARPTVADITGDTHYAQLARNTWLNSSKPLRVLPTVVKRELWDHLEEEGFAFGSLLLLEQLQLLEKYLWPGYSDEASDHHVLLLALLVNTKRREGLPVWNTFEPNPALFSSLFRRILALTIDTTISIPLRSDLLAFITNAFQSLESGLVRKECAPLVSISIWHNLQSETVREQKLGSNVQLRKAWRASVKRYDAADEVTKARLRFERSWLYTLLLDFLGHLYDPAAEDTHDKVLYCERFSELLCDLESQLPTRRYINTLVQDLNLLPATRLSPMYNDEDNGLLRDLYNLLRHYVYFPVDDHTGQPLSREEYRQEHYKKLATLQKVALRHFPEKLKLLVLSHYGGLEARSELEGLLTPLADAEILELCSILGLRTEYPKSSNVVQDRPFLTELILFTHEKRSTYQENIRDMTILPTDSTLYESTFLRNESYTGSRPLAIPKLNLQYLTIGDFLWRSFILHRCETFYEIRKDMEDTVKRVQPRRAGAEIRFEGFSRMALPIAKPAIVEVVPPKVGDVAPAQVKAEIILDVSRLNPGIRKDWESLRSDDVVFLLAVQPLESSRATTNGHAALHPAEKAGIKHLRCAEVISVLDENGRFLREHNTGQTDGYSHQPRQRRLLLRLDPAAYKEDKERSNQGKPDIWQSINLIVRRKGRENNFKPILESIKRLALSDVPAPTWLHEVFLGFGDPTSATYKRLPNRLKCIDYRDTFLDWQHLIQSLPGKVVEPAGDMDASLPPPYVLETSAATETSVARPSKKRRREQVDASQADSVEVVKVSTYKPSNTGPYPSDAPKLNTVRFTPLQIEAIASGSQPGLTVIVGPPGTGKTDVATQIINNIYHDFPDQRTLLVAHSNQALNQLFQKIAALDIDERHLLRLGHGEEELEIQGSYSKYGRVESFLENGARYLTEVTRLAASIGAPGAHGNSCETADYFNAVYIRPAWTKYQETLSSQSASTEDIIMAFPFKIYFSTAPQPLFPPGLSRGQITDIIRGCYHHIQRIFSELEDIRPFEILRNARDKANYLLIKEARIIAMTSTHAAMRRQEIAGLGFHYDNVIMEEAAQITEIENFIPLALQNPKDGQMPLQRIVLCGDHLQNSPIVQNLAFRQYANLEQSLFLRLVRLGVPTIMLDQQGRARPSLAELYKWRYPNLGNLPSVTSTPEFVRANAGLRYDYQFIETRDYKGKGETEPSPHFIQNIGEAEYAVALYMYMRLLGYPAEKISILTTYAGQRALIRDILAHRCKGKRLFGLPRHVSTVDKFQGEQNDYIILSLTRTRAPGYLRDIRRLTVALSRARLGLYVLGRREVFESCFELHSAFDLLWRRPDKLMLVTNEMFPTQRGVDEEVEATAMEGVEHLGQYVFEMTNAKVEALKAGGGMLPPPAPERFDDDDEIEGDGLNEGDGGPEPEEPEVVE